GRVAGKHGPVVPERLERSEVEDVDGATGLVARVPKAEPRLPGDQPGDLLRLGPNALGNGLQHLGSGVPVESEPDAAREVERAPALRSAEQRSPTDRPAREGGADGKRRRAPMLLPADQAERGEERKRRRAHTAVPRRSW